MISNIEQKSVNCVYQVKVKRSPFVTEAGGAPETRSPSKSLVDWMTVGPILPSKTPFVDTADEVWAEETDPDGKKSSKEFELACKGVGAICEAGKGTGKAGDEDDFVLVFPSESKSNNTSAPPPEV